MKTHANARYRSSFYPMHLALLAVGDNILPVAWWTPISKSPFRFLIAVDKGNHSLALLREYAEAVLHFMPWEYRRAVIKAGYLHGDAVNKAQQLGLAFGPSTHLEHTGIIEQAYSAFELKVISEWPELSTDGDHVIFAFTVAAVHENARPERGTPILFLGYQNFATLGERWRFRK